MLHKVTKSQTRLTQLIAHTCPVRLKCIRVAKSVNSMSICITESDSTVRTYQWLSDRSPAKAQLGCFQFLPVVNNAFINIHVLFFV